MCVTLENDVCEMKSMYFCFSMSELLVFLKGCYISKKKKTEKMLVEMLISRGHIF